MFVNYHVILVGQPLPPERQDHLSGKTMALNLQTAWTMWMTFSLVCCSLQINAALLTIMGRLVHHNEVQPHLLGRIQMWRSHHLPLHMASRDGYHPHGEHRRRGTLGPGPSWCKFIT